MEKTKDTYVIVGMAIGDGDAAIVGRIGPNYANLEDFANANTGMMYDVALMSVNDPVDMLSEYVEALTEEPEMIISEMAVTMRRSVATANITDKLTALLQEGFSKTDDPNEIPKAAYDLADRLGVEYKR